MSGKKLVRGTIWAALCMAGMLYINSSVSKAYAVVVSGDGTRIRSAASTGSEVVEVVNAGSKLEVAGEETDGEGKTWYKVSINNQSGYVRSDTVKKESGEAQQPAASSAVVEEIPSQAATVKEDEVNVRKTASTNGSAVAKLAKGAAVTLTGTTVDSSNKTWYQVNFINNGANVTGFIREDFVELGDVVSETRASETSEGEGELANLYGDMPTEEETSANNDYETFFEPDQEGVNTWYLHDNTTQKRYKIEQLLQAEEVNASNMEIKDNAIGKMRIAVIVLAVLFVFALMAAGFFGFKYHDAREDEDDDDEEEDDFRKAPPVRKRGKEESEGREASRGADRAMRAPQRRPEAGAQRRPEAGMQKRPASGAPRRPEAENRQAQSRPQSKRPETERQKRPASGVARPGNAQMPKQARKAPAQQENAPVRNSARADVEWKSKNFLSRDEEGLDFSFIDMNEDV